MKLFLGVLVVFLSCAFAWRVEPVPIKVFDTSTDEMTVRTEFYLYYGDDHMRMYESYFWKEMRWIIIWDEDGEYLATMYVPGTGYLPPKPLHTRWQPEYSGSVLGGLPKEIGVFGMLIPELRRVFHVFPDVFYVSHTVDHGTIHVYFHLEHTEDYDFYQERLFEIATEI